MKQPSMIELMEFSTLAGNIRLQPPGQTFLTHGPGVWPPDRPAYWNAVKTHTVYLWQDARDYFKDAFESIKINAPAEYQWAVFLGIIAHTVASYRYFEEHPVTVLTNAERDKQKRLALKLQTSIVNHGAEIDPHRHGQLIQLLAEIQTAPAPDNFPRRTPKNPPMRQAIRMLDGEMRSRYGACPDRVLKDFAGFVADAEVDLRQYL